MIIGITENGEAIIYSSIDDALNEWKQFPSDLDSDVIIFYTKNGRWLKPIFEYAPKQWYQSGQKIKSIKLQETKEQENYQDTLNYLLKYEVKKLLPNKYVNNLEILKNMFPYNE